MHIKLKLKNGKVEITILNFSTNKPIKKINPINMAINIIPK